MSVSDLEHLYNIEMLPLVNNGKPKKLAVCASMRKLVFIMYGVLKNDCDFDAAY